MPECAPASWSAAALCRFFPGASEPSGRNGFMVPVHALIKERRLAMNLVAADVRRLHSFWTQVHGPNACAKRNQPFHEPWFWFTVATNLLAKAAAPCRFFLKLVPAP